MEEVMNVLRMIWSFLIGFIVITIPFFTGFLLLFVINHSSKGFEWVMIFPLWIVGLVIDIIIGYAVKICWGIGEEITGGK
jgi:hypothetical protein